jgi:putative hydrolase of the HAD superfamily
MPAAALQAVLFDAAGTLIEPSEPVGDRYARVAARHGVTLAAGRTQDAFVRILATEPPRCFPGAPPEEIPALERSWWRDLVAAVVRASDDTARFDDFDGFFSELFDEYASAAAWRALPGATELLDALRARGLRTGVVSNFDTRLEPILSGLALRQRLDVVVLPIDAGVAKPDPAIFAFALERLGVPAEASLYVGDDPAHDIGGAHAAGLWAIRSDRLATLSDLLERLEPLDADAPPV